MMKKIIWKHILKKENRWEFFLFHSYTIYKKLKLIFLGSYFHSCGSCVPSQQIFTIHNISISLMKLTYTHTRTNIINAFTFSRFYFPHFVSRMKNVKMYRFFILSPLLNTKYQFLHSFGSRMLAQHLWFNGFSFSQWKQSRKRPKELCVHGFPHNSTIDFNLNGC